MSFAFPAYVVGAHDLHRSGFGLHRAGVVHEQPDVVGRETRTNFVRGLVIVIAEDGKAASGKLLQGEQGLGQSAFGGVALHGESG